MGNPLIFVILAVASVVGLVIVLRRMAVRSDPLNERLQVYAALPDPRDRLGASRRRTWLTRMRVRLNAMFAGLTSEDLALKLMSANWPITAIEYIILRVVGTIAGFGLGWLISGMWLGGIGLALLAYFIPSVALRSGINRRQIKFQKQLVDVLVLMTGAVRAGFSFLQAIEVVVREIKPPASEEFARVLREVSIGRPVTQALTDLALRMDSKDLDLLVTAITIQYQVGGNLTTMLTSVTETIRERIRLYGEVRVLTTQARMTSYILALLPVFLAGILFVINPEYMSRLFDRSIICIPIGAVVGIILGFIIIQRLAKIDI
jgi:tight adherence protein B